MNKNETIINTLEDLISFECFLKKTYNSYLFRGQFDSNWKLESYTRRKFRGENNLGADAIISSKLLTLTTEEIVKSMLEMMGKDENKLKLLAELQHYGSGTLLIDFTSYFWHAVWFAISGHPFGTNEFFRISYFEIPKNKKDKNNINDFYAKEIYRCPDDIKNGLAQKSFFILDNSDNLEEDWNIKSILIPFSLRDQLLNFLDKNKIDATTIYPGLHGLYYKAQSYSKKSVLINALQFAETKKYEEALKKYDEILHYDSNYLLAYYNKGITFGEINEYEKAIECFNKVIQLDSSYFNAYIKKGIILEKLKKYDEAIICFNKALKINQFNNTSSHYRASSNKSFYYDEIISILTKAIQITPTYIKNYLVLGEIYCEKREYNLARNYYEKALEIDPNNKQIINKIKYLSNSSKF